MSEHATPTWRELPFGHLCARIVNGGTPATDNARYWGGHIPWITGADFTSKGIGEIRRYVTEAGVRSSATSVVKAGNLLVVTRTGVGKLAIAPCDIAISQDITGVYLDETQVDTRFAFHLLSREIEELKKLNQGTSINGIVRSDLERHRVSLPADTSQQRRIATVLSRVDSAIQAREALIEKHQQIKVGLMRDLFTCGVGLDGRLRPVNESVLTAFGRLPMQWRLGSILELTDPGRQPILTGPFGADLGSGDFLEEGVPVLRIGNVQAGHLALDDLLFVSHRKAQTLNRYRVKEGDLLFARQGATTGRNALADAQVEGNLINYHIIRVALDHDRCAPLFVEAAFASEVVKRQIERDKGRGTREGINTAQITSLAFPIAEVEEQRRIAAILSSQNDRINADRNVLRSLRMKKQGLMQDLLTGKVAVKFPEPAIPA